MDVASHHQLGEFSWSRPYQTDEISSKFAEFRILNLSSVVFNGRGFLPSDIPLGEATDSRSAGCWYCIGQAFKSSAPRMTEVEKMELSELKSLDFWLKTPGKITNHLKQSQAKRLQSCGNSMFLLKSIAPLKENLFSRTWMRATRGFRACIELLWLWLISFFIFFPVLFCSSLLTYFKKFYGLDSLQSSRNHAAQVFSAVPSCEKTATTERPTTCVFGHRKGALNVSCRISYNEHIPLNIQKAYIYMYKGSAGSKDNSKVF